MDKDDNGEGFVLQKMDEQAAWAIAARCGATPQEAMTAIREAERSLYGLQ